MTPGNSVLRLTGIRAAIFDLDDTLYPEESYAFSGFSAVAEWLRARFECPFDPAERMRALFQAGERRHIFDRLLAEMSHPDPKVVIPQMVHCYRSHQPNIRLHEDASSALQTLHGRFPLGLISDGPLVMQEKKVQALRLDRILEEILLTDRWGPEYWKPHVRAFELTETRLEARGCTLVYIADNCGKDFIAPRRLGWRTVWLRRPGGVYCDTPAPTGGEPEHTITSLAQLDLSR